MKKNHCRPPLPAVRRGLIVLAALLLAACAGTPAAPPASVAAPVPVAAAEPAPAPGVAPAPAAATPAAACTPCVCPKCGEPEIVPPPAKPLQPAEWSDLPGWRDGDHAGAWPAFRLSCQALRSRKQWPAWQPVCEAAVRLGDAPASATIRQLFESHLRPLAVVNPDHSREGLVTGYYEPLLRGSRTRQAPYLHAIYAPPDDLLTIDLANVLPELKDKRLRGRLQGNRVVPYYSRGELREREDSLTQKALVYVDDPIELFFLQIQGSGRVRLRDGSMLRVGYADQNGHPYQSIGRLLVEQGELKLENASMQGIQAWARANPDKLDALLNANPSYVFFRELGAGLVGRDDGPIGALGVPVTAGRSLAIDPRFVPLGAPIYLATTQPNSAQPLHRLMLAQDTGGAIRGAVRADFFWGFGSDAGHNAGRMKQRGRMWVLLPAQGGEP